MAAKFYSGVDLCNTELLRAKLQNLSAAPATAGAGMLYFDVSASNNTSKRALVYTGTGTGLGWKAFAYTEDIAGFSEDIADLQKDMSSILADYTPIATHNALATTVVGIDERLADIEAYFSTANDADNLINKWHEIVNFLNATEGDTLSSILETYVTNDEFDGLTSRVATLENKMTTIHDWYERVGKYFKYDVDAGAWYLDGDFYTTGENSASDAGDSVGGSGAILDYDTIVDALGFAPAKAADVTSLSNRVSTLEEGSTASGVQKKAFTVTPNSTAKQRFTHNFGTRDVVVQIYTPYSPYEQVYADVMAATTAAVDITFAEVPTVAYKVVVIG